MVAGHGGQQGQIAGRDSEVDRSGLPHQPLPTLQRAVGHHGEPGIKKMDIKSADEVAEMMLDIILPDLPFKGGDEVCVLISGLGSTPLLELYILYRKIGHLLEDKNIPVYKSYVGNLFTSLEMAGVTLTVMRLDDELKQLLDHPADAVHFKQL